MRLSLLLWLGLLSACASWHMPEEYGPSTETLQQYLEREWTPLSTPEIEVWPAHSGKLTGLPRKVSLEWKADIAQQHGFASEEAFRLAFRAQLSAWLEAQKHPEGLCTSVRLSSVKAPEGTHLKAEIEIVCR